MIIEQFQAKDAELPYKICQQAHPIPWSFKVFVDCLEPPYCGYLLRESNQTLGYYIVLNVLDEVTLMDIAISPLHRKKGLGRKLLSHCLIQATKQQMTQCWLEVRESNTAAIALYSEFGFKKIETRKNYYENPVDASGIKSREDGLVMQWVV